MVKFTDISVGDLVEYTSPLFEDYVVLGYVTDVGNSFLEAHWSDEKLDDKKTVLDSSNITGHWKVIDYTKEEAKMKNIEVGNLVRFTYLSGKNALGIVTWEEGNYYKAIWSDDPELTESNIRLPKDECITGVWEVVVHEPKKKEIKEGMLVTFKSIMYKGKELPGIVVSVGEYIKVYSSGSSKTINIAENRITGVYDVIVHEPKELSVQQEAANFRYKAVQGIINAHEAKNSPCSHVPPFKARQSFTREEFLQYGRDCYLQGQSDEINRKWDKLEYDKKGMITQTTLNGAKEKAYAEGAANALRGLFTFSDFDKSVLRTWKDQDFSTSVSNAALGLTGEAGEVADLIKKAIYHGRGFKNRYGEYPDILVEPSEKAIDVQDVKDELSDILFYVSAMSQEFGFTLEDIARHNKEKLEKRYEEGFTVEESAQKKDKLVKEYFTDMGRF